MKNQYWTKITWLKRWLRSTTGQWMRTTQQGKIYAKKPKNMTHVEETACEIFLSILKDKGCKLYYDIHTQECYLRS